MAKQNVVNDDGVYSWYKYIAQGDKSLDEHLKAWFDITDEQKDELPYDADAIMQDFMNQEKIYREYSPEEKRLYNGTASKELIKDGTVVRVYVDITKITLNIKEIEIVAKFERREYEPLEAFIAERLRDIVYDERYAPSFTVKDELRGVSFEKKLIQATVFVYSRVMDKFINLSAFVTNLSTNVGDGGGNFSMSLPTFRAEYEDDALVDLKDHNLIQIFEDVRGNQNFSISDALSAIKYIDAKLKKQGSGRGRSQKKPDEYDRTEVEVAEEQKNLYSSIIDGDVDEPTRAKSYFDVALSPQDLVFIKFERLVIEEYADDSDVVKKRQVKPFDDIGWEDINNGVWDMIGLIDDVSETLDYGSASAKMQIGGRDLSKLLLEDGIYFFPSSSTNLSFKTNYFNNAEKLKGDKTFERIFGQIQDLNLYTDKSISYLILYIFNKLTSLEVFPNSVFNGVRDDALDFAKGYKRNLREIKTLEDIPEEGLDGRTGVWNLCNYVFDDSIKNYYMVDSSLATDSGSIMNFIQKICKKPFVEFYTDTYNDRFYWIVRRPPFDKTGFTTNATMGISKANLLSTNLKMSDATAYSWYHLEMQRSFWGDKDASKFYEPAHFFPEFAEIFGNLPYEEVTKYVNQKGFGSQSIKDAFAQADAELEYLISTTVYLPFTRSGTITLTGDRRIKKGMNVYLEETGEMFFVKGVSNDYDVSSGGTSRTTTLEVERGMVYKHIDKYFSIVQSKEVTDSVRDRKFVFNVNNDVFDFFISKKQFD